MKIPLRLEPIAIEGHVVQRSGIRWLCQDGHTCQSGEVIGFCNIGLTPRPGSGRQPLPFRDENRDLQVALAPTIPGRLLMAPSPGGFHNLLQGQFPWSSDHAIGHIECSAAVDEKQTSALRMLMVCGRRVTEHAEMRGGLLTGWHDRSRAWWGNSSEPFGTLLCMGICEQVGIIRGEQWAFLELFAAVPGPAHVVYVADDLLMPSASVLCSQLKRTRAESDRMADDMVVSLGRLMVQEQAHGVDVLSDWMFASSLLKTLSRCPMLETYEVLTTDGLKRVGPPNAILLSINSDSPYVLRHKRRGYLINCHSFRVQEAGPLAKKWLTTDFEVVRKTIQDIERDYLELIDTVKSRTGARILILNGMSTRQADACFSYAPFKKPLGDGLRNVRAQELNLLLFDIARARDISIIDVDGLAADLGGGEHIPDGVHQSGKLQKLIRAEIIRVLHDRKISGFWQPPAKAPMHQGTEFQGAGVS